MQPWELLKALGNETRWRILKVLLENRELCVRGIHNCFTKDISTISRHIKVLERAGIVETRRRGREISVKVRDEEWVRKFVKEVETWCLKRD